MSCWNLEQIKNLVARYTDAGGEYAEEVKPGGVGLGTSILFDTAGKLKTFIIQEHYLNEWNSTHTVRAYREMPAKYKKMLIDGGLWE